MVRIVGLSRAGLTLAALVTLTGVSMNARSASAVIYCTTVGVPKGCVARPVAPVARAVVNPRCWCAGRRRAPRYAGQPWWSG